MGIEALRRQGRGEKWRGCPVPAVPSFLASLALEPATWLPQLPPGSLEGKGVFRQDLEGIDSWGREKMKSQQPQKEILGY